MTLTISIIAVALLVTFIVYRQSLEKKKYQDTTYSVSYTHLDVYKRQVQALNHRVYAAPPYPELHKKHNRETNFHIIR